jgi:hypothetical protein
MSTNRIIDDRPPARRVGAMLIRLLQWLAALEVRELLEATLRRLNGEGGR